MDPSDKLREMLSRRWDFYWELTATAVGVDESVDKTLIGLSAEEIRKGVNGQAFAPDLIRERVDALAAWSPALLIPLASEWLPPKELNPFIWWPSAWNPSLRHLKALNVIEREDVDVPDLSREVDILWSDLSEDVFSWQELKAQGQKAMQNLLGYDTLRKLARAKLQKEPISVADIRDMPVTMLRLLRGKYDLLDESAQTYLFSLAAAPFEEQEFPALLAEVCKEISAEVAEEMCQAVMRQLPTLKDPRKIIEVIYVLISDWRVP